MSDHRLDILSPDTGDRIPRVSLDVARDPRPHYCVDGRAPLWPDEAGAVSVIEPLFEGGARIVFVREQGTRMCRVLRLPRREP